jgi:hypothetical protein
MSIGVISDYDTFKSGLLLNSIPWRAFSIMRMKWISGCSFETRV